MKTKHTEILLVSRWVKNQRGYLEMHWQAAKPMRVANDTTHTPEAA